MAKSCGKPYAMTGQGISLSVTQNKGIVLLVQKGNFMMLQTMLLSSPMPCNLWGLTRRFILVRDRYSHPTRLFLGFEQIGKTSVSAVPRNQAAMVMTEDRPKGALKSLQASPPWNRHILIIIWTPSLLPGVTTIYLPSLGSPVLLISLGTRCECSSHAWLPLSIISLLSWLSCELISVGTRCEYSSRARGPACRSFQTTYLLAESLGTGPPSACFLSPGVLAPVRLVYSPGLNDKSPKRKQTWICPRVELVRPWRMVFRFSGLYSSVVLKPLSLSPKYSLTKAWERGTWVVLRPLLIWASVLGDGGTHSDEITSRGWQSPLCSPLLLTRAKEGGQLLSGYRCD